MTSKLKSLVLIMKSKIDNDAESPRAFGAASTEHVNGVKIDFKKIEVVIYD